MTGVLEKNSAAIWFNLNINFVYVQIAVFKI